LKNINFEKIFASIPEGIYILNNDAKIVYWNKEAENILGYSEDEVFGKSCSENIVMHCDKKNHGLCDTDSCIYKKIMTNNISIRQQFNYVDDKFGNKLILETTAFPYYNLDGNINGVIEIFHKVDPATLSEITYSKRFMEKIIPKGKLEFDNLFVHSKYIPRHFIGGDFFNFYKNDDNKIIFWFGDCESEGVSASLISVMLNSIIAKVKHTISKDNLSETLKTINNDFCYISENSVSASMLLGIFDCDKKEFTYANAGHPEIIHYINSDKKTVKYNFNSYLLGFMEDSTFSTKTISVSSKDLIFIFSDGAYEFKTSKRSYFSIDELMDTIDESINSSKEKDDILNICVNKLAAKNFDTSFSDDFSMCMIEIK